MSENLDKWKCLRCDEEFEHTSGTNPIVCPNPNCGRKGAFEALTGPFRFFKGKKFVPKLLADAITATRRFATHRQSHVMWAYGNGSYAADGEEVIRAVARGELMAESNESHVNETVAHIRETTYTDPDLFNPDIALVNVKNCIINLKNGGTLEHTPDIIFTNELPVDYAPSAECPKIMQFLSEILHPDDIPLVQEMTGYCLLRDYPIAKAFMLFGGGSNGKSTLLNLITALLGERNVATPALQDLITNRFAKANLYGKLANIHADIPAYKLKHTGPFKMLTGEDLIYAEKKHLEPFDFRNYAKLLYSANELPQTDDMSEAFWRRWVIIYFLKCFPEGDPRTDPNLLEKLTVPGELSGFLNWALEGLRRVLKNQRFTMTKTRGEIEGEWVMLTDSLRAFTANCAEYDPDQCVTKDNFDEAYRDYCSEHDTVPAEKSGIGRRLPTLMPKVTGKSRATIDGKQHRIWGGIRLLEPYGKFNLPVGGGDKTERQGKTYYGKKINGEKGSIVHTLDLSLCLPVVEKVGTKTPIDKETFSDLKKRLFDVFGANPFKPSQLPRHFSKSDLIRLSPIMDDMMKRGDLITVPLESGEVALRLVPK